jgi:eukaryotic-like serine/threonine-protein kinase
MRDDPRLQQLLDELVDSGSTPEEVCRSCPELLPEVRACWRRLRDVQAELDALFPIPTEPAAGPPAPPPEDMALPRVAGYEVEAVLGRGGMGIVFRARHLRLNRTVALKMLLGGAYAGPHERERFLREAEAVAGLRHPHVVQVHDVGEHDGRPYFTMEYVEGGSLAQKLAGTPQPARAAAALLVTLAGAVEAAHRGGIVHRDLKPANVLLTADGTPKVGDFGLARRLDGEAGLTRTGTALGTPSYMAPEQTGGKAGVIGPATDVYALGAILYELLTGRPPFRAETATETLLQVLHQEPVPPSRLNAKVPRDLETVCLKCLQKEPRLRYPTAGALAEDLRRFLEGRSIEARRMSRLEQAWRWCRRYPGLAASLAGTVVSLVGGTVVSLLFAFGEKAAREEANRREQDATASEAHAVASATEARREVEKLYVANGLRLAEGGDLFGALLWFAKPLQSDHGPVVDGAVHRLRLSNYLRHAPRPTLLDVFVHQGMVEHAALSADGRRVVTAGRDGVARLWDVATGRPLAAPLRHERGVTHVAFSPDGRALVTVGGVAGSSAVAARVWDVMTATPLTPPLEHPPGVTCAAFSPDGRRLVTGGADGTALVRDAATGRPLAPPLQHEGAVRQAAFSADGRTVVTASWEKVRVWDAATGRPLTPPLEHEEAVSGAAFGPDGRRVLSTAADGARVWDAATGRLLLPPLRHEGPLSQAAFSPDGGRVLTAGYQDGTVRLWDAATGQPVLRPLRHDEPVSGAVFSPDGRRVLSRAPNGARVWDAATGRLLLPPLRHEGPVSQAAFSADGRRVLTASYDGTARVWDLATGRAPALTLHQDNDLTAAAFSPDGARVVTAGSDHTARVWDAATGQPFGPPLGHGSPVAQAAFSPDGRRVVTASADHTARLWDATTGRPVTAPLRHEGPVAQAAFSPDGDRVLTAGHDQAARLWDAASGQPLTPPLQHPGAVLRAAFSPDGRRVVTLAWSDAGQEGSVRVWDAATGRPLSPPLSERGLRHAALSPDGRTLVTGGPDAARVWDAATNQPLTPPLRHQGRVECAAFSPDGRRVVTASADKTARVWDVATGQALTPPLQHQGEVLRAAFSPDGRLVVTAGSSADATARVWDAATGQPVTPPLPHAHGVFGAGFSPDGRRVLTVSYDRTARVWDVSPDERPTGELLLLVQLLHGHDLDRQGALVRLSAEEQRDALEKLRAQDPAEFRVTAEQARAWHRREAEASLKEKNPAAALFHTLHGTPLWPLPPGSRPW